MPARRALLLLATLLLLAACGGADDTTSGGDAGSEPAAAATPAEPEPSAPTSAPVAASSDAASEGASAGAEGTLDVSATDLGDIVVDGVGMTVYVFDNDTDGTSTCTGECETNWPPVSGAVTAAASLEADLLTTTEREDGSTQAVYDGKPLYYFAGDQAAGDTNGQGVGEVWWVIGPDGEKVTAEAAAADVGY
jgi:predicted lipoprotein with Yx(FWY)xxD motif